MESCRRNRKPRPLCKSEPLLEHQRPPSANVEPSALGSDFHPLQSYPWCRHCLCNAYLVVFVFFKISTPPKKGREKRFGKIQVAMNKLSFGSEKHQVSPHVAGMKEHKKKQHVEQNQVAASILRPNRFTLATEKKNFKVEVLDTQCVWRNFSGIQFVYTYGTDHTYLHLHIVSNASQKMVDVDAKTPQMVQHSVSTTIFQETARNKSYAYIVKTYSFNSMKYVIICNNLIINYICIYIYISLYIYTDI